MSGLPRSFTPSPLYGVTVGIVTDNELPEGKVKVEFHSFGGNLAHDCLVLQPYAGNKFGTFFIPEVGSEVLVAFIDSDMCDPVVLGCLWYGGDKPPDKDGSKDPKLLQTKGGHRILLDDSKGAEKIVIEAAKTKKSKGKNRIEIDSAGTITIEADKGKLVLKGGEVQIEATGILNLKGKTINLN